MDRPSFGIIVGLVVRGLLQALAGWMVDHHLLPGGYEVEWATAGALVVCTLLWSWGEKRKALRQTDALVQAAIQMPPGSTIADVRAVVKP